VDNIRNKKIRGASKKQKDMLKALNDKLKLMRATREKCEELAMTMEFLEGGAISNLRNHLRKYYDDYENELLRTNVDREVTKLIEQADVNRKEEDLLHSGAIGGLIKVEEEKKDLQEDGVLYGHLNWLHKLIDMS